METTGTPGSGAPTLEGKTTPQEHGQKSTYLTQAEGGILDTGDSGYNALTAGSAEKGIFTIVGGYVDEEGTVHKEIEMRAMSGHEEDLLGNRAVPVTQRMTGIMSSCVTRIGTITDRGQISKAVYKLPTGSRTHLLICLRRVTHWKKTKDIYDMEVRCPNQRCQKVGSYAVHLGELETWEMADPAKLQYDLKLEDSGSEVIWKVPTGAEDQVLAVVADSSSEAEILTYAILVRLVTVDGKRVEMGISDFLNHNHKKLQLSPKTQKQVLWVKNLSVGDRETFREAFEMNEPGVDTELDFECKFCHRDFLGALNVAQETFFFPSATRRRSKRRSST